MIIMVIFNITIVQVREFTKTCALKNANICNKKMKSEKKYEFLINNKRNTIICIGFIFQVNLPNHFCNTKKLR